MIPGVILGPGAVIDQDVACQQCGYNLRTLHLPGRCPECGTELEPSVREFALRRHELLPPDPQWARKIRAGAGLALVALALMVLPLYLPRQLFGMPFRNAPLSRTPGRVGLLAIECITWTLAWAAAWRLSSSEPFPDEPKRPHGIIAVSLRWLSTAYLLIPFAWAWATWDRQYATTARMIPYTVLFVAGLLSAFVLMWRIGQILGRRGAWLLCLLSWFLAFAVPLGAIYLQGELGLARERDPSSLGLILSLPVYPFGSAAILAELLNALLRGHLNIFWLWVFLAPPALASLLLVRIWFLYGPAALTPDECVKGRSRPSGAEAARAGKSAASSPP